MNIHIGLVPVFVAAGGIIGFGVAKFLESSDRTQTGSAAGQTLADLSRALTEENYNSGTYPESIANLEVPDAGGDFSAKMLKKVIYRKTATGYVAFVELLTSFMSSRVRLRSIDKSTPQLS